MSWELPCPWCDFKLVVFNRGGPYGAGEEAAERMKRHIAEHDRTWPAFLAEGTDDDPPSVGLTEEETQT